MTIRFIALQKWQMLLCFSSFCQEIKILFHRFAKKCFLSFSLSFPDFQWVVCNAWGQHVKSICKSASFHNKNQHVYICCTIDFQFVYMPVGYSVFGRGDFVQKTSSLFFALAISIYQINLDEIIKPRRNQQHVHMNKCYYILL